MLFCGKKRENGVGGGGASNTKKVAKPESKVIIDEDGAETIEMKCTPDQSQDAYSNSQIAANHNLARDLQTSVNIVDEKEQENLSTVRNSSPFSSTTAIGVVTPTPLAKISEHSAVTTCNETSTHKGLSNHVGENNCFLNVAIQTLWHLGPFRYEMQKLISSKNKASNGSSSELDTDVMEALCNLFVQYEHAKLSTIPSTELRKILSGLFDECRLGGIADANETLEAILERIHQECTPMCPHGSHKCLAHTVFGGLLLEQATCRSCGASSEPKIRNDFMHYVYAAELIALNEKQSHRPGPDMLRSRFGSLLHECMEVSFRSCPSQDRNHFKGRVFTSGATSPNTPNGGRSGAMTPNPMYGKFTDKDVLMAMDEFSCREDHLILTDTTSALHSPAQSPIQSRKPSIVTPAEIECNCAAEVRIKAVEPPNVLAISVAWTSAKQSVGTLRSFLSLISNTIQLADLFDINDKVASSNTSACNSPSRKSSLAASLSNALASASRRASVNSPGRKSSVTSPSRKSSVTSPGRKDSVNSPGRKSSVNSPTRGKKVFPLGDAATGPSYTFRGFVCYYGSHYVSIFQVQR